jgi:hypothetical protein
MQQGHLKGRQLQVHKGDPLDGCPTVAGALKGMLYVEGLLHLVTGVALVQPATEGVSVVS